MPGRRLAQTRVPCAPVTTSVARERTRSNCGGGTKVALPSVLDRTLALIVAVACTQVEPSIVQGGGEIATLSVSEAA